MLDVVRTDSTSFSSPSLARASLEDRVQQRFIVPAASLQVDPQGRLEHLGARPLPELSAVALADTALQHLHQLTKIPASYAASIDPDLHARSINQQLARVHVPATVIVEQDGREAPRRVVAVLEGGQFGIPHARVLDALIRTGVPARVTMGQGQLRVRSRVAAIEALPRDVLELDAEVEHAEWTARPSMASQLETRLYILRLVCTNGAIGFRNLATKRLLSWADDASLLRHLDEQLTRLHGVQALLGAAIRRMAEAIPTERELDDILDVVQRSAPAIAPQPLFAEAVSWWDHLNVVTDLAKRLSAPRERRLHVKAGSWLERFVEA